MKILICTQEYYPSGSGIANIVYYIVEKFKSLGHTCTVLSMEHVDINYNYTYATEKFAGIGLLLFWNKVAAYVNSNHKNFDIVWVHNPLFIKKIIAPNVASTHNNTYVKYYDLYKHSGYSFVVRSYYYFMKNAEVLCYKRNKFKASIASPAMAVELQSLGIDAQNIIYIPNGVDTSKFHSVAKKRLPLNFNPNAKILLCVGRITYQKNPHTLIKTISAISKKGFEIVLLWAGSGELFDEISELVSKEGLKNVFLLGKVPHIELVTLYSSCDAYILPSVYEGQPLTLFEAMSCGLPPIVSDIPNMSHLMLESGSGRIVNFDDVDKASEEIIDYLKNTDLEEESKKARQFAEKYHDWTIIANTYCAWFENEIIK